MTWATLYLPLSKSQRGWEVWKRMFAFDVGNQASPPQIRTVKLELAASQAGIHPWKYIHVGNTFYMLNTLLVGKKDYH